MLKLFKTGKFYHDGQFRVIRVLNGRHTHTFDLMKDGSIIFDNGKDDEYAIYFDAGEAETIWNKHFANLERFDRVVHTGKASLKL